jgi:hypothetical protein
MTVNAFASSVRSALLASCAICAGCGGIELAANNDGAVRDSPAVSDTRNDLSRDGIADAAMDAGRDMGVGTDGMDVTDAINDGPSPDCPSSVVGKVFFDACAPNSCATGEYCRYSEGRFQSDFGACVTIPACCSATCACILDQLPYTSCLDAGCSDEKGSIIVTCQQIPPP